MEFMVLVIVLFIILTVVLYNGSFFLTSMAKTRTHTEGKRLADSVASEINAAVNAGGGYSRKFYIQNNIYGAGDFIIISGNYTLIVDWQEGFAYSPTVTNSVQGTLAEGWNLINNTGGIIYVLPA